MPKRRQPYAIGWEPGSRTYWVTVKLRAQRVTVASSIRSASSGRRTLLSLPRRLLPMPEPTRADVDELVGPATPHFAYQIRARVHELVRDLPEDNPVRRHGEEKMELLDRLGHASSKADEGPRESPARPGWREIPSSARADSPLPSRR